MKNETQNKALFGKKRRNKAALRQTLLTLAVLADREGSLLRIMKRDGIDRARAEARLNSQPDDDFYRARADLLLHNRGSLAEFEANIDAFTEKYCK